MSSNRVSPILFIFAALALSTMISPAYSQQRNQTQPVQYSQQLIDEMKRLQKAALESDYALKQVAHLTNNIGPRMSGSAQSQRAVEYVADEMRKLGLDVKLEKVIVPHWVRGVETGALTQYTGQAPGTEQKIVLTALGGSVATPANGLVASIIVVNSFAELEALGESKIKGKIVLFNYKFDEQMQDQGHGEHAYGQAVAYRGGGASAAARFGAVAALNRSAGGGAWRMPHTGAMRYTDGIPRIPAASVTIEDADLIDYLANQGEVKMRLTLTPQTLPNAESYNVIADLKGSEFPNEIVIVSGHLDSWDLGTGALDDAAGVAVAMQVANICKQLNLKPKRTIRVIAWMNEEFGLMGGRTYFENQKTNLANHIAAIESDLGAGHPIGFITNISEEGVAMLQPIADVLLSSGAGVIDRIGSSAVADISPLEAAGVPGFAPHQDSKHYFKYHHTPGDTFDKVNPKELAENAAVMTVLAYGIANLDKPLPKNSRP